MIRRMAFVPGTIPEEGHHCPSLKYLNRHVKKPVGRKWYDLGIDLLEADDVVQLDRIQSEHSADFNTCCTKMFQLWLSKQPTASWNQLLDSLRQPGIELDHIAFKIKKMLLQSNPTGEQSSVESSVSVQTGSTSRSSTTCVLPKTESTPLEFSEDDEIFIAFLRLTEKFQEEFKGSSVNVNAVKRWCGAYCSQHGASLSLNVSSMDELFEIIETKLPHHNILNLKFLQMLAKVSKLDCLIKSVENYKIAFSSVKLSKLALSTVGMIKEIQIIKEDKNCTELVTKLKKSDLTFGQLDGLFAEIAEKILYLHTGVVLPQWAENGCVCIKWLIPSFLVEYAYHSACLNTDLFSDLDIISIIIGNYSVKLVDDADGKNPIQILCQHYSFLMENLQSAVVAEMMEQEKLLNSADLYVILNAPMDYMRNSYIFEHVRHMETPNLFRFLEILQKIDNQKHISEKLNKALKYAGFEQLIKDYYHVIMEDESRYSLKYNNNESNTSSKVIGPKRNRPILPVFSKVEESVVFSPCNIMLKYFDLFDNVTELLQFEKVLEAANNLMASETHHIKLFSTDFFKKCANAVAVLRTLFPYSNWCDHSILRGLLEACNCHEGFKLLDEFDTQIDFTIPISDYPLPNHQSSYMTPDVSSSHTVLAIRCEQQLSSLSLQYIGVVKSVILKIFDITDHACILLTATNYSSAILYWLIPQSIVSLIYSKVQGHSAYLYDNKILEIAVYPSYTFSTGNGNRIWSLTYSSEMAAVPRDTLQDTERDLLQQLISLETFHRANHATLQQKLVSTNNLMQKMQINVSTVIKLINELKKTQHGLLQSSTESDARFLSLQSSLKGATADFQHGFDDTNRLIKQTKIEVTEQSEKHVMKIEKEVQSCLSQISTDQDKRDKKLETAIENLQSSLQNELKQQNLGYNYIEAETYQIQIKNERERVAKAQEALLQVTAEKEKVEKLALEDHHKLLFEKQNMEKQLEKNTKDMTNLRRINSALSEDCERYISEINELSEEREKLNEKVMQCEECIEKLLSMCKEKDDEIQLQSNEINRLGNQVIYLDKKVNTLQDHMRGKKPSLATTEVKQKAQQPPHTMQQPHHTTQQPHYTMQQSHYTMQQSQYMMLQPQHTMQRPLDEMMGISGGSLGSYPPVYEAPSDVSHEPSLATTEVKQKTQQPPHTMQQSHNMMQQSQHMMQQPSDEMMGTSGGSLGYYRQAPSDGSSIPKSPQPGRMYKPNQVMGPSILMETEPKMWKLKRDVIPKIMDHWKVVGLRCLCFNTAVIAEIEKQGKSDPKHCCTILFDNWLAKEMGVTPKTWKKLLIQLGKIEEIADEVEEITKKLK